MTIEAIHLIEEFTIPLFALFHCALILISFRVMMETKNRKVALVSAWVFAFLFPYGAYRIEKIMQEQKEKENQL